MQLPLALRYPPDQRFETFVAADAAVASLRALAAGDSGAGSNAYVIGPSGAGKSHLLLAACAQCETLGRRAAYLPLASAAGRLRDALHALDGCDLLALDGLDAIAGHREDEVALFDAHNRAHDAGGSLLYAAREGPDALPLTLPDLRSRLSQCARVVLQALDDDGKRELLRRRAARRGLQLDEAALEWLLKRVDRDLVSLTALLDRLDAASLAAQRRITVPFLRDTLGADY